MHMAKLIQPELSGSSQALLLMLEHHRMPTERAMGRKITSSVLTWG